MKKGKKDRAGKRVDKSTTLSHLLGLFHCQDLMPFFQLLCSILFCATTFYAVRLILEIFQTFKKLMIKKIKIRVAQLGESLVPGRLDLSIKIVINRIVVANWAVSVIWY